VAIAQAFEFGGITLERLNRAMKVASAVADVKLTWSEVCQLCPCVFRTQRTTWRIVNTLACPYYRQLSVAVEQGLQRSAEQPVTSATPACAPIIKTDS